MTDFAGCYLTAAGLELSAKSGVNIVFTRAETGSGVYTSPEGIRDLVSLKHKQYDYELEGVEVKEELADAVFYVTNKGVTEAYKLTEIGIYAKAEENEEILYCIAFAYEENAETIDAETAGQITYCQKFCVETKISADANVTVQIGADHEWMVNYFIKYAGVVDLEEGTLQEQIHEKTEQLLQNDLALAAALNPDLVDAAFKKVFQNLDPETDPDAMTEDEIEEAIDTTWTGETSDDPDAMSSTEVTQALNTTWSGEASTDPDAMTPEEIDGAIEDATQ